MRKPAPSRTTFLAAALLASALLLAAPGSALASSTLGLSAGTFKFNMQAGSQATGQVVVMNAGNEPLKVMVYASDQKIDGKGVISYQTPTRADLTTMLLPASWTSIKMPANSKSIGNIPYLELKPGQKVPVRFTLNVPPGVTPGDHNVIIFFESFTPPTAGQGAQSIVSGRLGARITMRIAGQLVNKQEVRPFIVPEWVLGGEVPWDFTLHNIGNVDQRVTTTMTLLDRNDSTVVQAVALDKILNYAGTGIESTGTLLADKMPIGQFKVQLQLTPVDDSGNPLNGGAQQIVETRDIWLIPYWLVIAVGVIVVLAVVRLIWVIAARSTRRQVAKQAAAQAQAQAQAPAEQPAKRPFPDSEYED
jgi:hypothetical protein